MKTDHDNIITIDDSESVDTRHVEKPVISIERVSDKSTHIHSRGVVFYRIAITTCIFIIAVLALIAWHYRYELSTPNIPLSFSDKEMLNQIDAPFSPSACGTIHTRDSVLGVAFDLFSLDGLRASLETSLPDTADQSLVLFMRSADYRADGHVIGSLVVDGVKISDTERKSRVAYMAITNDGKPLIGISISDRVMNRIAETGGSYFRQYVLLSAGELPDKFQLHGKVERAAIGRTSDNRLYYILTRHAETMYDFADALREYGFSDAIYITGGNSYSFYRDDNGKTHSDSAVLSKIEKYSNIESTIPFLVFRNR